MEYASKGVAGAGLGLGIAGTALSLLNGNGAGLLNLGGMGCCPGAGYAGMGWHTGAPVNRYEATLIQEVANKDSQIALRDANIYNDQKLLEVYKYFDGQLNIIRGELKEQAVYNGVNTATVGCLQNQVQQLLSLTKLVVPNSSLCPGWGDVTVSITPATTTAAAG